LWKVPVAIFWMPVRPPNFAGAFPPPAVLPQTHAVPSPRTAMLEYWPAETPVAPVVRVDVGTGLSWGLEKLPTPTCPRVLFPQPQTLPSLRKAIVW
jgi:hypothetical protein